MDAKICFLSYCLSVSSPLQHLGEYADSPIRSMKYNSPTTNKTPTPSPYITATRGRESLPRSAQSSLSDKAEEDEILVVNAPTRNINHSKHHGNTSLSDSDEKSQAMNGIGEEVSSVPQAKSSSKSRRRRKQVNEVEKDLEDKPQSAGGRAGNRSQRSRAEDDKGGSGGDETDISAKVESLVSGQLLANGYHKGASPDKKRSPNNPSTKPSTRAKISGR